MKNDKKIENLLKYWMIFKDEELSLLSNEDKKYLLSFEGYKAKCIANFILMVI